MAIVIDTRSAAGEVHVVDRKGSRTTLLLVCGDDPKKAVSETAKRPIQVLPLGLASSGKRLRLNVTSMPSGRQFFQMPDFVDQAGRQMEQGVTRFDLTPDIAGEWGWRRESSEPPPAVSGPAVPA